MKTEQILVSDSYQAYLLNYLSRNPELAAAYLTTTLEEENPEPELLKQALSQVYQSLLATENGNSSALLNLTEATAVYKFVSLLQDLGLKIMIASS